MRVFLICLIAVVLVAGLYVWVHRILINRATIMLRQRAQHVTDQAVNQCLQEDLAWDRSLQSELVADVWGKGVLAFEYHFPVTELASLTRERLEQDLNDYASRHQLANEVAAFVVTDWWQYEQVQHVDVAYLLNEATKEYVADLKKIDH